MANYALDTTAYEKLKQQYNKSVDTNTANQIANAQNTANSNLRQAYVTRLQNQQKLNQNLAQAGIRGGTTETANLGLATNYANQRNTINSQLASDTRSINNTAEQNKLSYAQEIDTAKQQAIENYNAEMRGYAREDEATAYSRRTEKLTATYSKVYSEKELKADLKTAKKNKDNLAIQVINARLGYLRQHKKGY